MSKVFKFVIQCKLNWKYLSTNFFLPLVLMFILYSHNSRNVTFQLTVSSELSIHFDQTTRCHIPSNLSKPRYSFFHLTLLTFLLQDVKDCIIERQFPFPFTCFITRRRNNFLCIWYETFTSRFVG
jgi:hypothetical protein